jgi:hypothetical protein
MNNTVNAQAAFNEAQSTLITLSKVNYNHFKRDFGYSDEQLTDFKKSAAEVDNDFVTNLGHFVEFSIPLEDEIAMADDFSHIMGLDDADADAAAYNVIDWENKI